MRALFELSRHWYQGRLAPDYDPPAPAERQHALAQVGLTGPFWALE